MKEQGKTSEKKKSLMKEREVIFSAPDKEFNVMVIRMLTKLRRRMKNTERTSTKRNST